MHVGGLVHIEGLQHPPHPQENQVVGENWKVLLHTGWEWSQGHSAVAPFPYQSVLVMYRLCHLQEAHSDG